MRPLVWLILLVLTACGGGTSPASTSLSPTPSPVEEQASGSENNSLSQTIDGQLVERSYSIRYPEDMQADSYPVVMFFHGAGGTGEDWLATDSEVLSLIDAGEFIGIFPDGYEQRWNVSDETLADDVEFVRLIINSLDGNGLFNLDKVYGVGVSNGAGLVNKIAKQTTLFAGIAPLISQQTQAIGDIVPLQAVSVFQVNGSADELVPVNGGSGVANSQFMSAQNSAENWASSFNCDLSPFNRALTWGGSAVQETTYTGCLNNKKVRFFIVEGAGHSTAFGEDVSLYGLIWAFFTATDREVALDFKLLALGDSYTIGERVCSSCRFPEQLKDSLKFAYSDQDTFELQIIARTGWTTSNLKSAIQAAELTPDFDLVTLLIGVNNQVQSKPFSLYEVEFAELVDSAIALVGGDATKLIVVSIPDYAFTPFGQNFNQQLISDELDLYNDYAEQYCAENELSYVYITDITRQGLDNPELVAIDGLHPSELAYSRFVARILPLALEKLQSVSQ